jgi:septum formation protein
MPLRQTVVLASASPYRRELLSRLLADFTQVATGIDETPLAGEQPVAMAARLSRLKAEAARKGHPAAVIIGSDQVAALAETRLGKPGTAGRAVEQLLLCSGRTVDFYTGVCVLARAHEEPLLHVDRTQVRFRALTSAEAAAYVALDEPLDCAGSFRAESRGVVLLDEILTSDPTAIQGLPLIWLANALGRCGITLL